MVPFFRHIRIPVNRMWGYASTEGKKGPPPSSRILALVVVNSEDIVPQDRVKIARCSLHLHVKDRRILVGSIRRQVCRESVQSRSKIVGFYRGRAQPLHGVAAFLDRLSRPIDSAVEFLLALLRAF